MVCLAAAGDYFDDLPINGARRKDIYDHHHDAVNEPVSVFPSTTRIGLLG
jgi:hypothetical protein